MTETEKRRETRRAYNRRNFTNDGRSVRDYNPGRRSTSEMMLMERTTLPSAPCFPCGARGWCEHRQPDPIA